MTLGLLLALAPVLAQPVPLTGMPRLHVDRDCERSDGKDRLLVRWIQHEGPRFTRIKDGQTEVVVDCGAEVEIDNGTRVEAMSGFCPRHWEIEIHEDAGQPNASLLDLRLGQQWIRNYRCVVVPRSDGAPL